MKKAITKLLARIRAAATTPLTQEQAETEAASWLYSSLDPLDNPLRLG